MDVLQQIKAEVERLKEWQPIATPSLNQLLSFLDSLQANHQVKTESRKNNRLEYWLRLFGMPEENIDNCITQIAQGYGACRYLEGVAHGAEAVTELNKDAGMRAIDDSGDIAKEIERYYHENLGFILGPTDTKKIIEHIAVHFANWQKSQYKDTIDLKDMLSSKERLMMKAFEEKDTDLKE